MGEVRMSITDPDGHVREGDFTRRSDLACTRYPIQMSFCSATADEEVSDPTGAFSVEFQIRRAPLPDLRPVNIKVLDLPGSTNKSVCMAVQNIELGEPGPFELALQIDGAVPPSGRATAGGLPPGDASERCVQVALPTSGQHRLTAVADEPNTVLEYNETNNVYEQTYTATASAPAPSRALPDLTVKAIKVNGHAPDGKDVCREGKNDVTVVVKNGATTNAGDFLVRLVVDDDDGDLRQKGLDDGLEAGAEREVRFDEVRLKKGPRSLAATADPTIGISESDEGNNTLKVTATCKDDE
jgi:subtilase family serine protease